MVIIFVSAAILPVDFFVSALVLTLCGGVTVSLAAYLKLATSKKMKKQNKVVWESEKPCALDCS
jgi:hypothetical protein